jgi:hypothetical protein
MQSVSANFDVLGTQDAPPVHHGTHHRKTCPVTLRQPARSSHCEGHGTAEIHPIYLLDI